MYEATPQRTTRCEIEEPDGAECDAIHWLPFLNPSQLGFEFLAVFDLGEQREAPCPR